MTLLLPSSSRPLSCPRLRPGWFRRFWVRSLVWCSLVSCRSSAAAELQQIGAGQQEQLGRYAVAVGLLVAAVVALGLLWWLGSVILSLVNKRD